MKIAAITIIIFLSFISCQTNKKSKNIVSETTEKRQLENALLTSYCFYKLDEKYSVENDSLSINRWLEEKSNLILKNKSVDNIFAHNGGGPNGAEWNPSTDLYIAIIASSKQKGLNELPKLFINGKLYEQKVMEYNQNLTWYKVGLDFWEKEIRSIDSTDIKEMYPNDFLENAKDENNELSDYFYTGEILKFEISFQGDTITNFFHAAFGE